jgi:hypothetical protein
MLYSAARSRAFSYSHCRCPGLSVSIAVSSEPKYRGLLHLLRNSSTRGSLRSAVKQGFHCTYTCGFSILKKPALKQCIACTAKSHFARPSASFPRAMLDATRGHSCQGIPPCSFGQRINFAYSMQCSGSRGVLAIVHRGNVRFGGNRDMVHSKQAVCPGMMTRAWPTNPAYPCGWSLLKQTTHCN